MSDNDEMNSIIDIIGWSRDELAKKGDWVTVDLNFQEKESYIRPPHGKYKLLYLNKIIEVGDYISFDSSLRYERNHYPLSLYLNPITWILEVMMLVTGSKAHVHQMDVCFKCDEIR